MTVKIALECALAMNVVLILCALILMASRSLFRDYYALAALLMVRLVDQAVSLVVFYFRKNLGLDKAVAYHLYVSVHYVGSILVYASLLLVIYSVFKTAMRPFDGLHQIGKLVFRWAGVASVVVTLAFALGPNLHVGSYLVAAAGRVEQVIDVLVLLLLLFVGLSTRKLGLTFRSYSFGITVGLGIFATTGLIEAAWSSTAGAQSVYSSLYLFAAFGCAASVSVWLAYFALPEPKREMILLPTTSPYFFWNAISEAMGADPGMVSISGLPPNLLTSAELKVITATTKLGRERQRREAAEIVEASFAGQPMPAQPLSLTH